MFAPCRGHAPGMFDKLLFAHELTAANCPIYWILQSPNAHHVVRKMRVMIWVGRVPFVPHIIQYIADFLRRRVFV